VAENLRKRLDRKRCVVCGSPPAGHTGYVYYQSGITRLYAPFCKEHLDKAPEYANPIFENQEAVDLFRQMFPVTYLQDVKGKPILFFDSHKTPKEN
jgi:hypothetical protein